MHAFNETLIIRPSGHTCYIWLSMQSSYCFLKLLGVPQLFWLFFQPPLSLNPFEIHLYDCNNWLRLTFWLANWMKLHFLEPSPISVTINCDISIFLLCKHDNSLVNGFNICGKQNSLFSVGSVIVFCYTSELKIEQTAKNDLLEAGCLKDLPRF